MLKHVCAIHPYRDVENKAFSRGLTFYCSSISKDYFFCKSAMFLDKKSNFGTIPINNANFIGLT